MAAMVEIVGAPFDLCGRAPGSRLGPVAMALAGIHNVLESLGYDVREAPGGCAPDGFMPSCDDERFQLAKAAYLRLRDSVARVCAEGVPLVIGGDHSVSIGSISGALRRYGSDLAVVWIDAHMDVNLPGASPSGNLHGMPLAALARLSCGPQHRMASFWASLLSEVVGEPGLQPGRIAWLALREVDAGELEALCRLPGCCATTMEDVDRLGVSGVMTKLDEWLEGSGAKAVWVSFDVDALDPLYAPGTGTGVRGGLTDREGYLIAEQLADRFATGGAWKLAGVDVVEVNPLADRDNVTALMAVDWVASLFGRRILGRKP